MNGNKEILFVDIDEVSSRTVEDGVYPIVNATYGTNLSHHTTTNYRDAFGNEIKENGKVITLQRKIEIFNGAILQDRGKNLIRPVPGSVERIQEFSEGYHIEMLTARHPMLKEYTPERVQHVYREAVRGVLFSNCYHGGTLRKPDICKERGARLMVEDDIDYALELAKARIKVFLLLKPWNEKRSEKHRNIERVDTWWDIRL